MASLYPTPGGWRIGYKANGRRRYTKTIRNLKLANQMLATIEFTAEAADLGLIDARADEFSRHERTPLKDHAKSYAAAMKSTGVTEKHVARTRALILQILTAGSFERISDLRQDDVQQAIEAWGKQGERVDDRSLRTQNSAVTAMKAFSRWLRRSGRIAFHPLADLSSFNAKTDPKHPRRAYTQEEMQNLVATAATKARRGTSGEDRAMLYRVIFGTGLRLSEALSLTAASFHPTATRPFIRLAAKDEKNRKGIDQPIRHDLATLLLAWLPKRGIKAPLWVFSSRPNDALQADLKDAGIPYPDADGFYLDFHAMRHTYITFGLRAGVPLRVMQDLARHSTPVLTAHYGHMGAVDLYAALDKLPSPKVVDVRKEKKA